MLHRNFIKGLRSHSRIVETEQNPTQVTNEISTKYNDEQVPRKKRKCNRKRLKYDNIETEQVFSEEDNASQSEIKQSLLSTGSHLHFNLGMFPSSSITSKSNKEGDDIHDHVNILLSSSNQTEDLPNQSNTNKLNISNDIISQENKVQSFLGEDTSDPKHLNRKNPTKSASESDTTIFNESGLLPDNKITKTSDNIKPSVVSQENHENETQKTYFESDSLDDSDENPLMIDLSVVDSESE